MACTAKRSDVSAIVITILEADNPAYRPITEDTPLRDINGLGLSAARLRKYYILVRNALVPFGCQMDGLSEDDFAVPATVGALVDLIFKALKPLPSVEATELSRPIAISADKRQLGSKAKRKPSGKKTGKERRKGSGRAR
jgi:hypothetical protein